MRTMPKPAGGGRGPETNRPEFIRRADEYRAGGALAGQVLDLLGADHPFPVLHLAELRDWFESGGYERIIRGEYARRGEADRACAEGARETFGAATDAARRVVDSFRTGFNRS